MNEHFRTNAYRMRKWVAEELADIEYDISRADTKASTLRRERAAKQRELADIDAIIAQQEARGWK